MSVVLNGIFYILDNQNTWPSKILGQEEQDLFKYKRIQEERIYIEEGPVYNTNTFLIY